VAEDDIGVRFLALLELELRTQGCGVFLEPENMVRRPLERAGRCISQLEVVADGRERNFVKMGVSWLRMEGQCKGVVNNPLHM